MPSSHIARDRKTDLIFDFEQEPALRVFGRTARYYGFTNCAICCFSPHEGRPRPLALTENWPMTWCHEYLEDESFRHDPIMQYDRTYRPEIFNWKDVIRNLSQSPLANEVITRRRVNGVGFGYSIPLQLPAGDQVAVHLTSKQDIELPEAERTVIVMAAQMLAGIFTSRLQGAEPMTPISKLEKEILCWASLGKSPGETAEVMGLTDNEIIFYLESARHKLGAANWTHAVVLALHKKLIRL